MRELVRSSDASFTAYLRSTKSGTELRAGTMNNAHLNVGITKSFFFDTLDLMRIIFLRDELSMISLNEQIFVYSNINTHGDLLL